MSQWARAPGPPNLMRTLWAVPSLSRACHAPLASGWQSVHTDSLALSTIDHGWAQAAALLIALSVAPFSRTSEFGHNV